MTIVMFSRRQEWSISGELREEKILCVLEQEEKCGAHEARSDANQGGVKKYATQDAESQRCPQGFTDRKKGA